MTIELCKSRKPWTLWIDFDRSIVYAPIGWDLKLRGKKKQTIYLDSHTEITPSSNVTGVQMVGSELNHRRAKRREETKNFPVHSTDNVRKKYLPNFWSFYANKWLKRLLHPFKKTTINCSPLHVGRNLFLPLEYHSNQSTIKDISVAHFLANFKSFR